MPSFFLGKKYRCGWSKENRVNRVIVYPTFCFKMFCIGYTPELVKVFCYLYIDSYQHCK